MQCCAVYYAIFYILSHNILIHGYSILLMLQTDTHTIHWRKFRNSFMFGGNNEKSLLEVKWESNRKHESHFMFTVQNVIIVMSYRHKNGYVTEKYPRSETYCFRNKILLYNNGGMGVIQHRQNNKNFSFALYLPSNLRLFIDFMDRFYDYLIDSFASRK